MSNLKVLSIPSLTNAGRNLHYGINQVIWNVGRYLPRYGVEYVDTENEADLIASNAGQTTGQCDVAHCHGLYPTGHPGYARETWHHEINRRVIADILEAYAVTVPSQWVADILKRELHIAPDVIGFGVNVEEWRGGTPSGYVLWNKNRTEGVCTPGPMNALARKVPSVRFISTFGEAAPNVQVIGQKPFNEMRSLVANASMYLATTKETFGIGTLEALAAGVPVLGFNWGGTKDIVRHGITGYLTQPRDIDGLVTGLEWITKHHAKLSRNARIDAMRFKWPDVARRYADVYHRAYARKQRVENAVKHQWTLRDRPVVSVVIPCYNYAQYVADAIHSVANQQTNVPYEIIIVDDASTDNSAAVIKEIMQEYDGKAPRITLIGNERNSGVSITRNNGIAEASGTFVACMDADDQMGPQWIDVCAKALLQDQQLDIAYTGLRFLRDDQMSEVRNWPGQYDKEAMLSGSNQIPSLCMFRREYWKRAGGFRTRYEHTEDARFWLDMVELGATAKQVTREGLFWYRLHAQSASRTAAAPKWNDKTWQLHGSDRPAAIDTVPLIRDVDQPDVSIIIPVGPGHDVYLWDALDSVKGQTYFNWEAIVVTDGPVTPTMHRIMEAYPWARFYGTDDKGTSYGPAKARNMGLDKARAGLVVFLDADDMLLPEFLSRTITAYQQTGNYVYTDFYHDCDGKLDHFQTDDFMPGLIFKRGLFHAVTCLIPTEWCPRFDETMRSWEDWVFYADLHIQGHCGVRVDKPLFRYRVHTGTRREQGALLKRDLKAELRQRYREYIKGEKVCQCREGKPPKQVYNLDDSEMVRVLYNGPTARHQVIGPVTKTNYGRRKGGDRFYIYPQDVVLTTRAQFSILTDTKLPKPAVERIVGPPPELEASHVE